MCNEIQNAPPFQRVIEAVGGIRAMARLFGTRPSTVSGWKKRGRIPGEHLDFLNREREAGHLRRTFPDGTVLEITADDLFKAGARPRKNSCPDQVEDLIEETVEEVTGEAPTVRQTSGPG